MSTLLESEKRVGCFEDCSLRFVKACNRPCPQNCHHYFSINDRTISEQDIVKRYNAFRNDRDYHPK